MNAKSNCTSVSKYDIFLGANFIRALNVRIGYANDKTVVLVNHNTWILRDECCSTFEFKEPKLDDQEVYLSELAQSDDEFEKEFDIELAPKIENHETIALVLNQNNDFSKSMLKLLLLIEKVTAKSYKDLKKFDIGEHVIELTDNSPVFVPPYRMSEVERQLIREEAKLLLEAGFILKIGLFSANLFS